jgi:hypothetical protein
MTTTTYVPPGTSSGAMSTDAEFRLIGGGISTALAAIGFVKTADTGQINWATVVLPVAASTKKGYEIWRFNDTLQATAPIFVRIDYGSSVSGATVFGMWFTVGKGSDGAGNITGTILASTAAGYSGGGTGTFTNYLSSADGSAMIFALTPSSSGGPLIAVIERSRNPAGAATATGFTYLFKNAASSIATVTAYNYVAATGTAQTGWPVTLPLPTPMALAGKAPVFPAVVVDSVGNAWQPRSLVCGNVTDLGSYTVFTVPGWGVYMPLTGGSFGAFANRADVGGAIAWF